MAVVNLPNCLDFVQPDKEIIKIKDSIPRKNAIPPTIDGINKLSSVIFNGNPSVVIMSTFVMANTDTRKELAAKTEAFNMVLDSRVFISDTKKFAITAMENPPSNELIIMT
ncbi:MAG: hypothetical protein GY751_24260 [Bacteroidetes bacterium]|nr:hypothetical protein [Bacteroidota bacterium]